MSEIQNIRINNFELKLADSDDPIASKVSWSPANRGGANFKAHQMDFVNNKIIVRRSGKAKLLASIFVIPGFIAVLIGAPLAFMSGNIGPGIFAVVWGVLFGGMGLLLLGGKNFVFDKSAGVYFRDKESNRNVLLDPKDRGMLNSIHAIQLLAKQITGDSDSGSYMSYELNLVFKNGERLNIMDGGDCEYVESSAKQLATYLNVPIWKADYQAANFIYG